MSLVVSILEPEFDALARSALAQAAVADVIELRLDDVGDPGVARLSELVARIGKPVIVAVNRADAFGTFAGTRAERFSILRAAARAGARWIDVDWRDARAFADEGALAANCQRIVSRHETDATPADLEATLAELARAARPGERLKLVTHARSAEDGARVLALLARGAHDLVAFASGARGAFTRVVAPILGSPFTYAAPADLGPGARGPATAPGQWRADALRATWPARGPSSATAILAVLGKPVRHSLSPRLHGAAARARGLDQVYVAIEPDELGPFVDLCRAPNWRGFSVTAPFKEAALARAGAADEPARACGAANTLLREADGSWRATNTDVAGLERCFAAGFARREPRPPATARVTVIGTGGAARAAIVAARASGAGIVTVIGRDPVKRAALAREFGAEARALEEIGAAPCDVVVHCTPVGSRARPGQMPFDPRVLRPGTVVIDAAYRPARTPLLDAAARAGLVTVSGAEWFVEQAAAQFRAFTGATIEAGELRAELERALADEERALATRPIALVGLRASGKSTVGKILAERLGRAFVDLDLEIVRLANDPALETAGLVLSARGEPAFRELESRVLSAVLARAEPLVIATGGGVVESAANRARLAERATVAWLDVPVEEIQRRLTREPGSRPALLGASAIDEVPEVAARRAEAYAAVAAARVAWTGQTAEALAEEVGRALGFANLSALDG